jgi:hypothetical protein
MAGMYGVLTKGDANRLVNDVGQREVWDAAQAYLNQYVAEFQEASRVLVERVTTEPKARYYLPGGGMMQRRGGQAQSHAVRPGGYWDVALPLEEFGDQLAGTRNAMAKMTLEKMQNAIDTIRIRNTNARLFEMMKALFNNTVRTFPDEEYGNLSIQPLAIASDSVLYPPLAGTTTETTLDSYYGSNYLASAISDTNDPIVFIADKLRARFGTGSNSIVVAIHLDQKAKVEALADFEEVADPNIRPGANTAVVVGAPPAIPGSVIGRSGGAWVTVWNQIPSGYVFGYDMSQPMPLLERMHEPGAQIPRGLHLVTRSFDAASYPFDQSHYEDHFGYGVGNRMNGVCVQLVASTTYTIPTAYS